MKLWLRSDDFAFRRDDFQVNEPVFFRSVHIYIIYVFMHVWDRTKIAGLPGCDSQCKILSLRNPVPISHQRGPFLKGNESSEPSINFKGIVLFVGVVFTHTVLICFNNI